MHLADLAERALAERQSNMLNFLNMLAATKQRLNGANPDAVALPDSLSAGARRQARQVSMATDTIQAGAKYYSACGHALY